MKSASDSKPRPKWRLKNTLRRKPHFRPLEMDDVRFVWAAYKQGALASMGEDFEAGDMDPKEFAVRFHQEIFDNYAGSWAVFPSKKEKPCGLILGFYSHPEPRLSPFMIVGDIIWFPWATPRNRIECAVKFFSEIRKTIPMVEYANEKARPFFEMMAKHGIIRRVGTMHNVYKEEKTTVFETRTA